MSVNEPSFPIYLFLTFLCGQQLYLNIVNSLAGMFPFENMQNTPMAAFLSDNVGPLSVLCGTNYREEERKFGKVIHRRGK